MSRMASWNIALLHKVRNKSYPGAKIILANGQHTAQSYNAQLYVARNIILRDCASLTVSVRRQRTNDKLSSRHNKEKDLDVSLIYMNAEVNPEQTPRGIDIGGYPEYRDQRIVELLDMH